MIGGARVSPQKTLFPSAWSATTVEKAIKMAYKYGTKVKTQSDRVLIMGDAYNVTIELWLNTKTKTIETAYPI